MSEEPEKNDLAMEISMATFALRGYLTPLKGYGELLKAYLEVRQERDAPVKIEPPFEMEITPALAVQMMDIILKSVHDIYELQEELRRKVMGFSEE